MYGIAQLLKDSRIEMGLTQVSLAHLSGISLPTIQNIESNKANPSLSVLKSLFETLAIKIELKSSPANWVNLAECGAAITVLNQEKGSHIKPSPQVLLHNLKLACRELKNAKNTNSADSDHERKMQAVQSLFLALKLHFPSFYKKKCAKVPLFFEWVPKTGDVPGKLLRLYRHSVSVLATFL